MAIYNMNAGKDNTSRGGGRGSGSGVGSGLRGGKTKQVSRKRIDCGIVIREPDLSRGDGDAVSGRQRSQKLDPKHPNGKATVEKPTIWTKGPYLMVRPPKGPSISYRRGVRGSYHRMGEGDPMADLGGTLNSLSPDILDHRDGTTLRDLSRDILDDGDNDDDDAGDDGDDGYNGDDGDGVSEDDDNFEGDGDDLEGGDDDFEGGGDGDGRQFIQSNGKKFVDSKVHRRVKEILEQCLDGDWVTSKTIPQNVKTRMFDRFRTMYRWDPKAHQSIRHSFICVLKDRFRGIMSDMRKSSKKKALKARERIPDVGYNFEIQCKYPPNGVPRRKWERMCMSWSTKDWEKKSKAGRENRKNDLCRHTGGSKGFDEHRRNLEKIKGKKVGFAEVLLHTHATKECKKRLNDGEINANDYDKLQFVTDRSKRSYYGNTDCDDMEVWESLHPECQGRQLFGVGSSDPHFVLTGTTSSTASVSDTRQLHELQKVQAELEKEREARQNIEARFEQFEQEREQERVEREREREQERVERERERTEHARWQKYMEAKFNKFGKK
ncbi:putative transposase, Ptta/En/Spm, plant [Helianthus annuus]|nr:putative transposase, Ptta/En/Spm, plant [Helianthus annuus]